MIGLLFTTPDDAAPFLDQYTDARPDALGEDTPLQMDDVLVATTGVGKIKATLATERLLRTHDIDPLLHAGTCTALDDALSVGTVFGASFVLEGDRVELEAPVYPRMPLTCPVADATEGTLVSQDHTSEGEEESYWERLADARDSTGYPVAYVAAQHGTACHVVKGVSAADDGPAPEARRQARTAVAAAVQQVLTDEGGA
jgi:nucleoside phosphorylase